MTSEDLIQIEKIRQLKARYFRLLDEKRWAEWADVFCEDVRIDTTQDGAPLLEGRDAFVSFLPPVLEGVLTAHFGHTSEITLLDADHARGIWAMEDRLWFPPEKGGQTMHGTGWYHEKYRREGDGAWRIAEMVLRRSRVQFGDQQVFPPAPE